MLAPLARRSAARFGLALTLAGLVLPAPGCAKMRGHHAPRSWAPSFLGRRAAQDHNQNALVYDDSLALPPSAMADASQPVVLPTEDAIAQRLAERHTPRQALAQASPARTATQPALAPVLAPVAAPNALAANTDTPAPTLTRSTAPPAGAVLSAPTTTDQTALAPPSELPPLDLPPSASVAPSTGAGTAAPTPAPATATATSTPPASQVAQIRDLVAASSRQLETLRSYQVLMTRQERVGTNLLPEETVLLSIRRDPRAVRLEWPDGPNQGREVLYSADARGGGMMHVKMPNALLPRLSLPPDSPLALKNSRHPITEAGLEHIVAGLQATVNAHTSGTAGPGDRLTYEGLVAPAPDLPPGHCIKRVMTNGETWIVTLDATSHLPVLIEGTAGNGDCLERYVFRNLQSDLPDLAAADAFDPDARWGASRGLLGRIARSGSEADTDAATPPR